MSYSACVIRKAVLSNRQQTFGEFCKMLVPCSLVCYLLKYGTSNEGPRSQIGFIQFYIAGG